jgi:hypothetical protein
MLPNDLESLIPYEYYITKIKSFLMESEYKDELNVLIMELIQFKESGIYDSIFNKQTIDNNYQFLKLGGKFSKELIFKVNLISMAHKILDNPIIYPFNKKNLINFPDFFFLYKFLELRYFISLLRKLNQVDLYKLYFSGIDEIIIFNPDKFGIVNIFKEDLEEFFIELKNLEWESQETETFFSKLNNARTDLFYNSGSFSDDEVFSSRDSPTGSGLYTPSRMSPTFPPLNKRDFLAYATKGGSRSVYPINPINLVFSPCKNPYLNFPATENAFLLFLAGCSAVNPLMISRMSVNVEVS